MVKFSVLAIVLLIVLSPSARTADAQESPQPTARPAANVVALGSGFSVGQTGLRYAHQLPGSPLMLGLGVGDYGIVPHVEMTLGTHRLSSHALSGGTIGTSIGVGYVIRPVAHEVSFAYAEAALQFRPHPGRGMYFDVGGGVSLSPRYWNQSPLRLGRRAILRIQLAYAF